MVFRVCALVPMDIPLLLTVPFVGHSCHPITQLMSEEWMGGGGTYSSLAEDVVLGIMLQSKRS